MKIEYIQKCKCGAVTISFDNGASNSMFWETFEKLDLDAGDATWLHQSCCCNHCVNHWGIDLCECGSGARVGECECGSQKAHDTLGIKYDSFGAILKTLDNGYSEQIHRLVRTTETKRIICERFGACIIKKRS